MLGALLLTSLLLLLPYLRLWWSEGFWRVPVDGLDGRLILFLHEHWFQVITQKVSLLHPPFFWPLENTLGFSDAFFLNGLIYSCARFIGLDPWQSTVALIAVLKWTGCTGMFLLLRQVAGCSRGIAFLGSVLFTAGALAHNLLAHGHLQLLAIYVVPWVLVLIYHAATRKTSAQATFPAAVAGLLAAAIFPTGFYIAWYGLFAAALWASVFLLFYGIDLLRHPPPTIRSWQTVLWPFPAHLRVPFAIGVGLFGLGLLPFLLFYLPINAEYGGRQWDALHLTIPSFKEFFYLGINNVFWRPIYTLLDLPPEKFPQARSLGWAPFFGIACLLAAFRILRTPRRNDSDNRFPYLWQTTIASTAILLILNFRVGGYSLWQFVHENIPGASAIRYYQRFNFVLQIPLLLICARATCLPTTATHSTKLRLPALLVLLLLVAEQQPDRPSAYHPPLPEVRAQLANIPPPPSDATVFYIRTQLPDDIPQTPQLDAMQLAQRFALPTINGYSGVTLKNWWLYDPAAPWYPTEVLRWIKIHQKSPQSLYELQRETAQWSRILPTAPLEKDIKMPHP